MIGNFDIFSQNSNMAIFLTRARHYDQSFIFITQGYMRIPKLMRENIDILALYRIRHEGDIHEALNTVSGMVDMKQLRRIYNECVDPKFSCMTINDFLPTKNGMISCDYGEKIAKG